MDGQQSLNELSSRFIPLDEAAKILKVKKGTLQNWLSQGGKFKRIKLNGRTFLDRIEIEEKMRSALEV